MISITETSKEAMELLEKYGVKDKVLDQLPNNTSGAIIQQRGIELFLVKFDQGNDTPEYVALLAEDFNTADQISAREWFFHYVDRASLRIVGGDNEHLAA